jgi:hypothetical protein
VPGPSNIIASCVAGTSFIDTSPFYNITYYYAVRAEDSKTGGSGPCNGGDIDSNMVKKNAAATGPYSTAWSDDFETGMSNWTISSNWQWSNAQAHSGTYSAWSNNLNYQNCDTLTKTTLLTLPAGSAPVLHFWTYYNIESGYDNGIVLGSSNGTTFTKLNLTPGYPGIQSNGNLACLGPSGQPTFTGSGTIWTEYTADISSYAGNSFTVRFTYGTDASIGNGGWYIDDTKIEYGSTCTTVSGFPAGHLLNTLRITKSDSNPKLDWQPFYGTCCVIDTFAVYRGTLPWTGYNYTPLTCTISPASPTYTDTTADFSYYYLVVPLNSNYEGSYGTAFPSGSQRPPSASPCMTPQDPYPCD